jgi:hypothetical protein
MMNPIRLVTGLNASGCRANGPLAYLISRIGGSMKTPSSETSSFREPTSPLLSSVLADCISTSVCSGGWATWVCGMICFAFSAGAIFSDRIVFLFCEISNGSSDSSIVCNIYFSSVPVSRLMRVFHIFFASSIQAVSIFSRSQAVTDLICAPSSKVVHPVGLYHGHVTNYRPAWEACLFHGLKSSVSLFLLFSQYVIYRTVCVNCVIIA